MVKVKRTKVRKNGFKTPFAFLQLLAWLVAFYLFTSFIITLIALIMDNQLVEPSAIVAVIYLISFAALVISTAIVTGSDPSDPTVELYRKSMATKAAFHLGKVDKYVQFSEEDHAYFCVVCDSYVLCDSKHCM